ncbi:MAG: polysaccharide biosynthesis protein [Saprospiraceae bacterium]|nr:polysaccharide biosynthesis protein [Saprospiraceae bacterium]
MKKAFVINILLLLALNVLIKPVYIFGIDVQIQNTIGPKQYGLFFSIFNYTLLFQFILEYGITNFVKREISIHRHLASFYFSGISILKSGLAILYFILVMAFAWIFNYSGVEIGLIVKVAFIQLFLTLIAFLRGIIIGLGWYKTDGIFSVTDKLIMILLLGWKLYLPGTDPPDLNFFVVAYLFAVVFTAIIALLFLVFKLKVKWVRPDGELMLKLFRQATPFAFITFLMSAYGRLDAVLLHKLLADGDYQAGIYAAGFRMLDTYLMFALLFSNLLLPMLASQHKDKAGFNNLMKFVIGSVMTVTIIVGVGGFVYRSYLTDILYRQSNSGWYDTVGILFLCMIPVGLSTLYGAAIMSTGKLLRQNILFSCGIIGSITLNFILIPLLLSKGSAISALSINTLIAVGQVIIFNRESGINFNNSLYLRLIFFLIITFCVYYTAFLTPVSFIISGIISALMLIILAHRLHIITFDLQSFKRLISTTAKGE